MNKKPFSHKNKNLKYLEKNIKKKTVAKKNNAGIKINPILIKPSNNIYSNKQFEKLLRNYNDFIEKNFKGHNYREDEKENKEMKNNEYISDKLQEIKNEIRQNILINIKETNTQFNNFLDSIKYEYIEENISNELPDDADFYNKNIKLGLNKNNKNDFIRRRLELFKEDLLIIDEDLEFDTPIQEFKIENAENQDINIQLGLYINDNSNQNFPIIDDILKIREMIDSKKKIIEIYKEKMRVKIYVGSDSNGRNIIRIFGKNLIFKDNKQLITTIEFNSYSSKFKLYFTKIMTLQELFNVDYMTKEEIQQKIPDIINKFKSSKN